MRKGPSRLILAWGALPCPTGTAPVCLWTGQRRYQREMNYFLTYAMGKEEKSLNSPAQAYETCG